MHDLFAGTRRSVDIEFPIRTRTGEQRHWSFSASSPGMLRDGRRFIVGMAVDITDRKHAEAALRASEERLRTALSISTVGVMFWSDEGTLTDINNAFLAMTGFTREEALGRSWDELTPPEFLQRSAEFVDQVRATGEGTP